MTKTVDLANKVFQLGSKTFQLGDKMVDLTTEMVDLANKVFQLGSKLFQLGDKMVDLTTEMVDLANKVFQLGDKVFDLGDTNVKNVNFQPICLLFTPYICPHTIAKHICKTHKANAQSKFCKKACQFSYALAIFQIATCGIRFRSDI